MNPATYLTDLDAFTNAFRLCSPPTFVKHDLSIKRYLEKCGEPDLRPRLICVVRQTTVIGTITDRELVDRRLPEESKIGEVARPFAEELIDPAASFTEVLAAASASANELVFVGQHSQIQGSISIEDMLSLPGLTFLMALGTQLETSALELLCKFPRMIHGLADDRLENAVEHLTERKQPRAREIVRDLKTLGVSAGADLRRLELLQCTTMSDKKQLLVQFYDDLRIRDVSKQQIEGVFNAFERIRDYIVHPSAAFAHSLHSAEELIAHDHERITLPGELDEPFCLNVSRELGIDNFDVLARLLEDRAAVVASIERAPG